MLPTPIVLKKSGIISNLRSPSKKWKGKSRLSLRFFLILKYCNFMLFFNFHKYICEKYIYTITESGERHEWCKTLDILSTGFTKKI